MVISGWIQSNTLDKSSFRALTDEMCLSSSSFAMLLTNLTLCTCCSNASCIGNCCWKVSIIWQIGLKSLKDVNFLLSGMGSTWAFFQKPGNLLLSSMATMSVCAAPLFSTGWTWCWFSDSSQSLDVPPGNSHWRYSSHGSFHGRLCRRYYWTGDRLWTAFTLRATTEATLAQVHIYNGWWLVFFSYFSCRRMELATATLITCLPR